jgi:hypothetical protein
MSGRRALVVPLLLLCSAAAPAADLDVLLRSVVEVYGGDAAAAKMQSLRVDARVDAMMRQRNGRARRDFLAPDRLRVEIVYPETTEVRMLSGDVGWRGDATRLQRVEGLPNTAMLYQLLRSTVPWVLAHHRQRLEDRGTRTWNGTDYRLVGLPWSEQLDMLYWVNALNRRVERVEGTLRSLTMTMAFATEYRDFRRVAGVLIPFAEVNYAGGRLTGTTTVTAVVFDPPDPGPFDPGQPAR